MVEWGSSTFFRDHRMGVLKKGRWGFFAHNSAELNCKDTYAHMYMVSDAFIHICIHMFIYACAFAWITPNFMRLHLSHPILTFCLVLFVLPHFHDQHFTGCFIRQWYSLPKPQHQNPLLYVCKVQFSVAYPLVNQHSYGKSPLFLICKSTINEPCWIANSEFTGVSPHFSKLNPHAPAIFRIFRPSGQFPVPFLGWRAQGLVLQDLKRLKRCDPSDPSDLNPTWTQMDS